MRVPAEACWLVLAGVSSEDCAARWCHSCCRVLHRMVREEWREVSVLAPSSLAPSSSAVFVVAIDHAASNAPLPPVASVPRCIASLLGLFAPLPIFPRVEWNPRADHREASRPGTRTEMLRDIMSEHGFRT